MAAPNPESPWRHLFDLPDDVTYLNAAYLGPMSLATVAAGCDGMARKARPWEIVASDFFEPVAALRAALARLVGAEPEGLAITPSVSYGIAVAAANVPLPAGTRIVVLADQFPSNVYPWREAARRTGAEIETVERPDAGGWTAALLAAIDERVAVVSVPICHWTDGTIVDLVAIRERTREVGAVLVVDGSQSLGATPFDVAAVQPDFLVGVGYKWLLGPYSQAFMYVGPEHRDGSPIENNWINRAGSEDFSALVDYAAAFQPGARRFDVGQVSNFALVPAMRAALDQLLSWGVDAVHAHARTLTDLGAARAGALGLSVADPAERSAHLIGVRLPAGLDPRAVATGLAAERVYVSVRGDSIRLSAHAFNTASDVERLFDVLARLVDR